MLPFSLLHYFLTRSLAAWTNFMSSIQFRLHVSLNHYKTLLAMFSPFFSSAEFLDPVLSFMCVSRCLATELGPTCNCLQNSYDKIQEEKTLGLIKL